MNMYFPNTVHNEIYVDITFTQDLDFNTFPYQTFQSFTLNSDLYTIEMFSISFQILTNNSYRVIVQPKGYIFLYNSTIYCKIMDAPADRHFSASMKPFKTKNYGTSASLVWFVIKAP